MSKDSLKNVGPISDAQSGRSGNTLKPERKPRVPIAVQEQRNFNKRITIQGLSADPKYIRKVISEDN